MINRKDKNFDKSLYVVGEKRILLQINLGPVIACSLLRKKVPNFTCERVFGDEQKKRCLRQRGRKPRKKSLRRLLKEAVFNSSLDAPDVLWPDRKLRKPPFVIVTRRCGWNFGSSTAKKSLFWSNVNGIDNPQVSGKKNKPTMSNTRARSHGHIRSISLPTPRTTLDFGQRHVITRPKTKIIMSSCVRRREEILRSKVIYPMNLCQLLATEGRSKKQKPCFLTRPTYMLETSTYPPTFKPPIDFFKLFSGCGGVVLKITVKLTSEKKLRFWLGCFVISLSTCTLDKCVK